MRDIVRIEWKKYKIFKENVSTLKEISKDDSDPKNIQYMTESMNPAINFDDVKTQYANNLELSEEVVSSVDGIFESSECLIFAEFKNGKMQGEKSKVKDKIRDSLLMFCDITGEEIADTRKYAEFILVYNIQKNPMPNQLKKASFQESQSRVNIAKYLCDKANSEFIRFGLEKFKKIYFKDVHTFSTEEFEKYLVETTNI